MAFFQRKQKRVKRQITKRIKLAGYLFGIICLVMFPNLKVVPSQIVRRLDPSQTVITPNDPLVLQLRDTFFSEMINETDFAALSFNDQMNVIDEFIKIKIIWKSDFSQYGVIGLLTSPNDVITRMAGDCQGQAATTASLILSINQMDFMKSPGHAMRKGEMGPHVMRSRRWNHAKNHRGQHHVPNRNWQRFARQNHRAHQQLNNLYLSQQPVYFNAWVVETPFHWWTHASNNNTGQTHNLNYHGSAGLQGSVLPQPIDLVYTNPAKACTNCSWVDANNNSPYLYVANPIRAFAIAWTGGHIFLRSNWSLFQVDWLTDILGIGTALAILTTFYASYLREDFSFCALLHRFAKSFVLCVGPVMTGLSFWTTIHYPVTLLHLLGLVTFSFYFVARS